MRDDGLPGRLPNEGKAEYKVQVHYFPVHLRNAFKAWCDLRQISMSEKCRSLMRECLKDTKFPDPDLMINPKKESWREKQRKASARLYCRLNVGSIPRETGLQFRAWCTLRGLTIGEQLVKMIKLLIQDTHLPIERLRQ